MPCPKFDSCMSNRTDGMHSCGDFGCAGEEPKPVTLKSLREGIDKAEEALSEAQEAMMNYVKPIILAHTGKDRIWGWYHSMWESKDEVHITLRDNASGGPYDHTYRIPKAVFAATDAIAAADAARRAVEAATAANQRAAEEAEFERLRLKLGKA